MQVNPRVQSNYKNRNIPVFQAKTGIKLEFAFPNISCKLRPQNKSQRLYSILIVRISLLRRSNAKIEPCRSAQKSNLYVKYKSGSRRFKLGSISLQKLSTFFLGLYFPVLLFLFLQIRLDSVIYLVPQSLFCAVLARKNRSEGHI